MYPRTGKRRYSRSQSRSKYSNKPKGSKFKRIFKRKVKRNYRKSLKQGGKSKMAVALGMAKLLPDQVYLDNYSDFAQNTATTSQACTQFMWAIQQDITNTATSIQQASVNLMPHDLGIIQQILFQQPAVSGVSSGIKTSQVLIKNWTVSAVLTNLESGPIELWHYRCKARRDLGPVGTASGPDGILSGGFADAQAPQISGGLPTGVTGPISATTYGSTPFMNPRFVGTIQVIKSKKHILNPAKRLRLSYSLKKPRLWKSEDFLYGNSPDGDGSTAVTRSVLKGQHFSVFVIAGTYATAASANTGFKRGIGNASVGIIYQHRVHYASITPAVMQTSAMNAVAGFSATVAGYPAPVFMNQPISVINDTTGSRVIGTTFPDVVQDFNMTN